MSKVGESCACNVDRRADWCQDENKSVHWWRGRLIADGHYCIILIVAESREGRLLLMNGQDGSIGRGSMFEVRRRDSGRVGWVCRKGTRGEEGNRDRELGRQKQRQVEKTCPGN